MFLIGQMYVVMWFFGCLAISIFILEVVPEIMLFHKQLHKEKKPQANCSFLPESYQKNQIVLK